MQVIHNPVVDVSDQDLQRRVSLFLATRNTPSLRRLQVEAHDGTIFLRGRVSSFYEKQLSQACSGRVSGVRQVVNEIEVFDIPVQRVDRSSASDGNRRGAPPRPAPARPPRSQAPAAAGASLVARASFANWR